MQAKTIALIVGILFLATTLSAMSEIPSEIGLNDREYVVKEKYLGSTKQGTVISQYFSMPEEVLFIKTKDERVVIEQTGKKDLIISIDTITYLGRRRETVFIETINKVYRYDLVFDVEAVQINSN